VSRDRRPSESLREWITGLVVIVATIVSFIGFARLSVGWTLAISSVILVALVVFLWSVGERKRRRPR
jgi:hypothetical protein